MHKWITPGGVRPIKITDRDGDELTVYPADPGDGWDTPRLTAQSNGGASRGLVCVRLEDPDRRALIEALGGVAGDA